MIARLHPARATKQTPKNPARETFIGIFSACILGLICYGIIWIGLTL